jgi:hypothetical protein
MHNHKVIGICTASEADTEAKCFANHPITGTVNNK